MKAWIVWLAFQILPVDEFVTDCDKDGCIVGMFVDRESNETVDLFEIYVGEDEGEPGVTGIVMPVR